MSFRLRLLLAMAPLLLALLAVGISAGVVTSMLAKQPMHILSANYRSVLCAQRIIDALERLDKSALTALSGYPEPEENLREYRSRLAEELLVASQNITEEGEKEVIDRLQAGWVRYQALLANYAGSPEDQTKERYFQELLPAFKKIKQDAATILNINQDAMVHKGDRTLRRGARYEQALWGMVILLATLGLWASISLTRRLLRPLAVVSEAVKRFGQGDTQARARLETRDEVGLLAQEFNTLADSLERYRKSSLGELLQAQQAAQAAIDALPDPVLMLDSGGKVQGSNQAAATFLGLDSESLGDPMLGLLDPSVRASLSRMCTHVGSGYGPYHPKGFEDSLRLLTPQGERIYLPRATPIYGEADSITGTAVVFQDITTVFRFDQLKSDLVATVAHEFRTPLTSLRMAIHLCTEHAVGPLTEKQADLLFAARDDCERLQGIVDDLLNLSRIESGRMDLRKRRLPPDSPVHLALDTHRLAAEARKITLRLELWPSLPEIFVDPDRLQLVFTNLLTNAIRYSPEGSEIVVRAYASPGDTADDESAAYLRFEVQDQGPGIPMNLQSGLFEKFFRIPGSPAGGAGLGLFIARGIVQAHGGQIGVLSGEGQGATFWFTLPLAPQTPGSTPVGDTPHL